MEPPRTPRSQATDSSSMLSSNQMNTNSSIEPSNRSGTPFRSRSASSTPTVATTYSDPATELFQLKLRERKAELQRQGKLTKEKQTNGTDGLLVKKTNRHGSGMNSLQHRGEPDSKQYGRQMGLRQQEEHVSKIDKQNFDLKLRIYHQDKRLDQLLVELEEREGEWKKMEKLLDDQQRELERRDASLKQAVDTILIMDEKINRLERLMQDRGLEDCKTDIAPSVTADAEHEPSEHDCSVGVESTKGLRNSFAESVLSLTASHEAFSNEMSHNLRSIKSRRSYLRPASAMSRFTEDSLYAPDRLATKSPAFSVLSEGDLESVYAWKEQRQMFAKGVVPSEMEEAVSDEEDDAPVCWSRDEDDLYTASDHEGETKQRAAVVMEKRGKTVFDPDHNSQTGLLEPKQASSTTLKKEITALDMSISDANSVFASIPLTSTAPSRRQRSASPAKRAALISPPAKTAPAVEATPPRRVRLENPTSPTTPHSATLPVRTRQLSTPPTSNPPHSAPSSNAQRLAPKHHPLPDLPKLDHLSAPRLAPPPKRNNQAGISPLRHGYEHRLRPRRSRSLSAKEEQLLKYIEGIDRDFYIRGPKEMMLAAGMFSPQYELAPETAVVGREDEKQRRHLRTDDAKDQQYDGPAPPDTQASAAFSRRHASYNRERHVKFASDEQEAPAEDSAKQAPHERGSAGGEQDATAGPKKRAWSFRAFGGKK